MNTAYTKETKDFFTLKFKSYINEYVTALRFWEEEFAKGTKKITSSLLDFLVLQWSLLLLTSKKNNISTASFQHAILKKLVKIYYL